jgi:hypothetical protein
MILVVRRRAALSTIGHFRSTRTAVGRRPGKKLCRCFPSVEWLENRRSGKQLDAALHGKGSSVYAWMAAGR